MSSPQAGADTEATAHITHTATLTPAFKLVFLTVLGLTTTALILNVFLVVLLNEPNDQAKNLIDTCSTITKAGFGAIVGLIGGKAV
jgi:hypothetical protein